MKKIFLDTNIFIDLLTDREIKKIDIEKLEQYLHKSLVYISVLSVHIAYYVLKIKPNSTTHEKVQKLISLMNLVSLSEITTVLTLKTFNKDFEDTLQYYSAIESGCEKILTRDIKDYNSIKRNIPSNIHIVSSLEEI